MMIIYDDQFFMLAAFASDEWKFFVLCLCQNYASLLHFTQFKVNEHGFLLLFLRHVLFALRNKNKNNSFIRKIYLIMMKGSRQKLSEVSSITQKSKKSNLYKILNPPSSLSITLSYFFSFSYSLYHSSER